jgi:hypothetical protein
MMKKRIATWISSRLWALSRLLRFIAREITGWGNNGRAACKQCGYRAHLTNMDLQGRCMGCWPESEFDV